MATISFEEASKMASPGNTASFDSLATPKQTVSFEQLAQPEIPISPPPEGFPPLRPPTPAENPALRNSPFSDTNSIPEKIALSIKKANEDPLGALSESAGTIASKLGASSGWANRLARDVYSGVQSLGPLGAEFAPLAFGPSKGALNATGIPNLLSQLLLIPRLPLIQRQRL